MHQPIIEVRNIGKKYDIAHMRGGYIALRDVIANIFKNPGSYIAHKAKRAVGLEKKEEFWALKGVNFTVNRGEVIGIIGANGAGKSTLLKILSQITPPTDGEIIIRGRIGSLLEVGTGFHPELTGRENIFLNGAILGMKKEEIARKFDKIVAFAGVDKFLDTPVKHYSSGMYVRLAFSVAAHMDPDILLVDEVLAVGDAEFQRKCLGKMDEITKSEGRTILFVSHNMDAIRRLCHRSVLLRNGRIAKIGPTAEVLDEYLKTEEIATQVPINAQRRGDGRIRLTSFHLEDKDGNRITTTKSGSTVKFVFGYECPDPKSVQKVDMGFSVQKNEVMIAKMYGSDTESYITKIGKSGQFEFTIKNIPLAFGIYTVKGRVLADGIEADWPQKSIGSFEVSGVAWHEEGNFKNDPELVVIPQGKWSQSVEEK